MLCLLVSLGAEPRRGVTASYMYMYNFCISVSIFCRYGFFCEGCCYLRCMAHATMASAQTPLLPSTTDTPSSATPHEADGRLLCRVADRLPATGWMIATIELCERFAFFGVVGPMQNYIQNAPGDASRPGGLGTFPPPHPIHLPIHTSTSIHLYVNNETADFGII